MRKKVDDRRKIDDDRRKKDDDRRKKDDRKKKDGESDKVKDRKGEKKEVGKLDENSLIFDIEAVAPPKCVAVRAKMANDKNRWNTRRNFNHGIIFIIIGRLS